MTTGSATITMVIPAYGVGGMICDALDSLLAQSRQDWLAIVVDDGDPRAADHVRPYLDDDRFTFLQTDNGGPSTARNRGMSKATTEYIGLIDGDDQLDPDFLSAMLAAFTSDRVGFVTCDATFFGADRNGELFSSYCPQKLPASLERVIRREFNVFSQTVMRREAIMGIGGFDTSLISSEDFDAWIRMMESGWELAYIPRPLVRYRRHGLQASRNSTGMLRTALVATGRARERLKGRPEELAAAEMCSELEKDIEVAEAFELLHQGQTRPALAKFARVNTDRLTGKWRLILRLLRIAPFLAGPLLKLRT
ncbi:glycosyltransferase family 2 protein [Sphingomonas sp. SRS2]|uniref:glycosyltransferase family 2 protein n=1 Tax=Sphingomonas sp. SRS2 TaxID=133190 RepID=UPI0006184C87|nr:glycosyltransferase family A protein [Sphingomonas sp. SRS2]KKC26054.1 multidrug ABC transporter permease [Sphingomonas sp. SRS2]